jgi:hypothetical protein
MGMGETTRKQQHEAAIRTLARDIAKNGASPGVVLSLFKAYAFAAGVAKGEGGGWIYPYGRDHLAINGWRKFAEHLLDDRANFGEQTDALIAKMGEARAYANSIEVGTGTMPLADPVGAGEYIAKRLAGPATAEIDPLIGARVSVVGEHAGRGRIETMNPTTGQPYVGFDDGRRAHVHPLSVTVIDESAEPGYVPHSTAGRVKFGGTVFAVGDRVICTGSPSDGTRWRIDRIYVPTDREPFAGLTDPDDTKPGTRGTALRLGLLAHADATPSGGRTLADVFRDGEQLLGKLREEIAAAQPADTDPATDDSVSDLVDRIVRRSQYLALREVLDVLDGWIKGNAENAEGGVGELEAVHRFHSQDIRHMINDAARELGVPEPYRGNR